MIQPILPVSPYPGRSSKSEIVGLINDSNSHGEKVMFCLPLDYRSLIYENGPKTTKNIFFMHKILSGL